MSLLNFIKLLISLFVFYGFWSFFGFNANAVEAKGQNNLPVVITPHIIGGGDVNPGDWPWMAALVNSDSSDYYSGYFCGGALIAKTWVLTAAHCLRSDDPGKIDVVLGLNNLKTDTGYRMRVKRIIRHPAYNQMAFDNDIALLELEQPASAQSISLFSDRADDLAGVNAIVTGWGDTDPTSYSLYPENLQQVSVPVVTNATCSASYPEMITDNMLCAGFVEGGKDACFADSGGPLVVQIGAQWMHAGVVSWGEGCAQPGVYGVYTRTSRFIDFITPYIILQPSISVYPPTVRFGYVPLGASREQGVVIRNQGPGDLVIGNIGQNNPLEPPFTISHDSCSNITLAPSGQCLLTVSYTPETLQNYKVNFDIPNNDQSTGTFTGYVTAREQYPWNLFVPAITTQ